MVSKILRVLPCKILSVISICPSSLNNSTVKSVSFKLDDLHCLNQGIKTLSIMFLSIDLPSLMSREQLNEAVSIVIEKEKKQGLVCYNNDDVLTRTDLALDCALSHEMI